MSREFKVKEFAMYHLFFKGEPELFSERDPPDWLLHKEYSWWFDEHVLTLNVGQSIKSDFRKIVRLK